MKSTNTLILSREGIFPIDGTTTGIGLSGTLQGEGKLVGTPSMFVRLQGCNLRCIWTAANGKPCLCDTAHASFGYGTPQTMLVTDIFNTLKNNMKAIRHVVITGGEPFLQASATCQLIELCEAEGWHTTIETNGTIYSSQIAQHASLLSISPKLTSSIPTESKLTAMGIKPSKIFAQHEATITNIQPLISLIDEAQKHNTDIQLKFVVSAQNDEFEIKERYANALKLISPTDVLIMPMGYTSDEITQSNKAALTMCLRNNWRYTPRLHIDLFGNKEGV